MKQFGAHRAVPRTLAPREDEARSVYLAMAHVAWADERLAKAEMEALVAASRWLGIDDGTRDLVDILLCSPCVLPPELLVGHEQDVRALAFAGAAWIALVDGHSSPQEERVLREIERAAALPPSLAQVLAMGARRVRFLSLRQVEAFREFEMVRAMVADTLGTQASRARLERLGHPMACSGS